MDSTFKLVTSFVDSAALIMALVLMVSILSRVTKRRIVRAGIKGILFSLAVIYTMSDPIQLPTGGIYDMRALLIGSAVALFGPIAGLMSLITGVVYRYYIGDPGLIPGLITMVAAFGGGLLWYLTVRERRFATWKKSLLLGAMLSFQVVALLFSAPQFQAMLVATLMPYMVATSFIGAFLFNHLVGGELSFQSAAESAKIQANSDHLTGLLNRRGMERVIPTLKTKFATNRGRALLYFDIDNFKSANDTHGHALGDVILAKMAGIISENLRRNDIFARMGGDEFAIILPDVDAQEAQLIAERCRAIVATEDFREGPSTVPVTISLGAVWLHEPHDTDGMFAAADRALYQAKDNGRNAVVFQSGLRNLNRFSTLPEVAPDLT